MSREHAFEIWRAAVDAVRPAPLVEQAIRSEPAIREAPRVYVVGAGKAGAGMAEGLEAAFADRLDRLEGLVNVPEGSVSRLRRIRLHDARPQGVNEPTAAGVAGADEMLRLLSNAQPTDAAVCLLSGGGSALLPAPAEGISLEDKRFVTRLLHRCGATIDEMNCVRKHLSRIKGGRLAAAFTGRCMLSLIISDVVGDRLDVIASGPTAPDTTTFATALEVLDRYQLRSKVPDNVLEYLTRGVNGLIPETPKAPHPRVINRIIANNQLALTAAAARATELGYTIYNMGSAVVGETIDVANEHVDLLLRILQTNQPVKPPCCLLSGGETTVTLGNQPGKGGRNQEYVLAAMVRLGDYRKKNITIFSAGTDGEDGPTDAAGAVADTSVWEQIRVKNLNPRDALTRHDAYPFFDTAGGLFRTGLTGTNVMDVRVILVNESWN